MQGTDALPSGSRSPCLAHVEAVLPARDVGRELVAVLAVVAAHVALEGVSEAVAAHVDGVHDVVQEEHAAVFAGFQEVERVSMGFLYLPDVPSPPCICKLLFCIEF